MATVEPLSRGMLENYLKDVGWKFLMDSDEDFRVDFAHDDERGCSISVWLLRMGQEKEIYAVRIHSDKRIQKNDWGKAMMVCNEWNRERRWPKAFLYVSDPATDSSGEILLEEQIDFEKGTHQKLLDDFTHTTIVAADQFWKWVTEGRRL